MEEKVFTINLRKDGLKSSRQKKSNRASSAVREYLRKHMKTDTGSIRIGDSINKKIWSRGNQKPPAKIKIKAIKTDDGLVKAEMWGHVFEEEVKEEKPKKTEEKTKESTGEEKKSETKEKEPETKETKEKPKSTNK